MDTKWALKYIDKVVYELRDLSTSGTSIYNKSRGRLVEIAKKSNEIISLISSILETNVLESDQTDIVRQDVAQAISKMKAEIAALEKFVGPKCTAFEPYEDSRDTIVSRPRAKGSDLTVAQRKELMKNFKSAVSMLPLSEYQEAARCGSLISEWFDVRFYRGMKPNTAYRYNIARIPEWISSIIIGYGKHLQSGDIDDYITEFQQWFDLVTDPATDCTYSLPFEVFQLTGNLTESDISLHGLVLYDLLLDAGLNNVCKENDPYLFDPYMILDKMEDVCNTTLLDSYVYYKEDPSILSKLNLNIKREEAEE